MNPNVLLCVNCCIFPLIVFAVGVGVGKLWGRVRIQSPLRYESGPMPVEQRQRDKVGFGSSR